MLKLLKYEWKACARICLPLYGAMLLMSVVSAVMTTERAKDFMNGIPSAILAMLFFALLVAVFVVTAVILIQRFYKNLLGDEGYLMFTLPVTVSQHIWAKTIIAVAMSIISIAAAVLSIGIIGSGAQMLVGLGDVLAGIGKSFTSDPNTLFYTLESIIWLLLLAGAAMLFIYLCMALGHLAKKHRVLMSVVWYFVLSTIAQFLFMFFIMGVGNLPLEGFWMALNDFFRGVGVAGTIHIGMITLCLGTAVVGAVFFLATRYILKNKLNLE